MYANDNKLKVNKRRLTKRQVVEKISQNAKLREDLSSFFSKTTTIGNVKEYPKVYELTSGNFLYVFDENDVSIAGKGDIYSPLVFNRIIKLYERFLRDKEKHIGSSELMWRYYSKMGNNLIDNIEVLKLEFANRLNINEPGLDSTYKSLDLISRELNKMEIDTIRELYYDHLVAYIGEVIRKRVNGEWKLNKNFAGENYPYIDIGIERCQLMPLNVLLIEFTKIMELDFRKATANEIRANSYYTAMNKRKPK